MKGGGWGGGYGRQHIPFGVAAPIPFDETAVGLLPTQTLTSPLIGCLCPDTGPPPHPLSLPPPISDPPTLCPCGLPARALDGAAKEAPSLPQDGFWVGAFRQSTRGLGRGACLPTMSATTRPGKGTSLLGPKRPVGSCYLPPSPLHALLFYQTPTGVGTSSASSNLLLFVNQHRPSAHPHTLCRRWADP